MPKVQPRDISPILQKFRNFLLGRQHTPALRFEEFVATRSPPPPELPDGPCHKLSNNYYFARDVRREVKPPALVASNKAAIAAAEVKSKKSQKPSTPGKVYNWDKPVYDYPDVKKQKNEKCKKQTNVEAKKQTNVEAKKQANVKAKAQKAK